MFYYSQLPTNGAKWSEMEANHRLQIQNPLRVSVHRAQNASYFIKAHLQFNSVFFSLFRSLWLQYNL